MSYRVLIVEDSAVMRRMLRQALESDPEIEVAGVAGNGKIALKMIAQEMAAPDAIVLDLEMPEMDGLATLRELRTRGLQTPVVMFSSLTERGALATLDALAAGADDYVAKPADSGNPREALLRIRLEVLPRIKALCWKSQRATRNAPLSLPGAQPGALQCASPAATTHGAPLQTMPLSAPPASMVSSTSAKDGQAGGPKIDIVAIGASTGGPNALTQVLARIPADFPVPIVIVQHMPPTFTRFLAERLTAASPLLVREAVSGARLEPGHAWVAPGDFHMDLRRDGPSVQLEVFQSGPENSCRPAVDVLFRSVAQVYGENALAVVMTGMGQDGFRGCESIAQARGQVIAQDEASSVVWGMPGYVARAGLTNCVIPLDEIADEIVRRVSRGRRILAGAPSNPSEAAAGSPGTRAIGAATPASQLQASTPESQTRAFRGSWGSRDSQQARPTSVQGGTHGA